MNLYDKDDGFRCFTLHEANAMLPQVIHVTEESLKLLDDARKDYEAGKLRDEDICYKDFEKLSAEILQDWAEKIVAFGVYPKGYFTVDFKSPVPDTLFCWTYGENKISYIHKIYESFKSRVPIENEGQVGFEQTLN